MRGLLIWRCPDCGHFHSRMFRRCTQDYRAPKLDDVACRCPRRKP